MGYKLSVIACVMNTSNRKDCTLEQGPWINFHSSNIPFNRNEHKGLKLWGAIWIGNTNDHFQHQINKRKYKIWKGAFLVMMGLTEIYNEMNISFQMNIKPLCEVIWYEKNAECYLVPYSIILQWKAMGTSICF